MFHANLPYCAICLIFTFHSLVLCATINKFHFMMHTLARKHLVCGADSKRYKRSAKKPRRAQHVKHNAVNGAWFFHFE